MGFSSRTMQEGRGLAHCVCVPAFSAHLGMCILFAVLLGCKANDPPVEFDQADPRVAEEVKRLEGEWEVIADGVLGDGLHLRELIFDSVGVTIRTSLGAGGPFSRVLTPLDPTQQPRWIDFAQYASPGIDIVFADPKDATPKTFLAVYDLQEDGTLRIRCSERPGRRPKNLTSDEGCDTWYAELKRRPPQPQRRGW